MDAEENIAQRNIFRFKNQSAIETNPIESEKKVIGWQAKFYDVPLSRKKEDLLSSIKKAKDDYPKITNLIFYTNQEWGQYKGKKPKGYWRIPPSAPEVEEFQVRLIPTIVILSKEGKIIGKIIVDPPKNKTLEEALLEILEKQ